MYRFEMPSPTAQDGAHMKTIEVELQRDPRTGLTRSITAGFSWEAKAPPVDTWKQVEAAVKKSADVFKTADEVRLETGQSKQKQTKLLFGASPRPAAASPAASSGGPADTPAAAAPAADTPAADTPAAASATPNLQPSPREGPDLETPDPKRTRHEGETTNQRDG